MYSKYKMILLIIMPLYNVTIHKIKTEFETINLLYIQLKLNYSLDLYNRVEIHGHREVAVNMMVAEEAKSLNYLHFPMSWLLCSDSCQMGCWKDIDSNELQLLYCHS